MKRIAQIKPQRAFQVRNSLRIKNFCWKQKDGSFVPLSKLSDDRLIRNYDSIKQRFEKAEIELKSLKGFELTKERHKQNTREITFLALQQELDNRNILIS